MMNFKFFQREEPTHNNYILFTPTTFTPANVEFCFQFGNNEPVIFATGPNECSIRLSPTSDANMIFTDNDREFKLFARERQND
jgi:hypothetical protein